MVQRKRRYAKPKAAAPRRRAKIRSPVAADAIAPAETSTALVPAPEDAAEISPVMATTQQALIKVLADRELDGRQGANRCRSERRQNQLGVDTDVQAVFAWLDDRAAASPDTWRDYLSQARRLFWWALERCPNSDRPPRYVGKALSSLTRLDLMTYKEFLKAPDRDALGPRRPFLDQDGRLNPDWRPFVGPLNGAHIEHVFLVLKNLFRYLADVGYLDGNPLEQAKAKEKGSMGDHSKRTRQPIERKLDAEQWLAVLAAIERLPQGTDEEQHYYERARFMMQLFFHLGARVGELATHNMEWFLLKEKTTADAQDEWVWSVMGKGGKEAEVPVNEALLAALARYRIFLGRTPFPHTRDPTPLLLDQKREHGIGERQIARLVKEIFALAADDLKNTNPNKAATLAIASPHWIRHAMASFAAERAKDMKQILGLRDLMRHSDLATTLRYVHIADEAKKMISDWLTQAGTPSRPQRLK